LVRSFGSGVLLTDDRRARASAESLGIQVVPTIRILSTASELSLVDFEDAVRRLQKTNFRISGETIEDIRKSRTVQS
jgi:predicted nucleic acid-binding protein